MEIDKGVDVESSNVPNTSTVGFPRSLSNALMVSPTLKRKTLLRRLRKAILRVSRRVG
jgi:flagellar hook protein FlgE